MNRVLLSYLLSAILILLFYPEISIAQSGDAGPSVLNYLPDVSKFVLIVIFVLIVFQEAINGFHDTGSIIASVIYSNALKPQYAVAISAVCNFLGVLLGGTAVALALLNLLPVGMVAGINDISEISFFLAMITTAVFWNFTTWYFGIPNSTTHTYIGAILGVTIAHSYIYTNSFLGEVDWHHGEIVILALILSPILGFLLAYLVYKLLKILIKDQRMYEPSEIGVRPPFYIRAFLIGSSGLLSLMHGSNDGQKSIGLLMLVVVGLAPFLYGINQDMTNKEYLQLNAELAKIESLAKKYQDDETLGLFSEDLYELANQSNTAISQYSSIKEIPKSLYDRVRTDLLKLYRTSGRYVKVGENLDKLDNKEIELIEELRSDLRIMILYVPIWIPILSALALGLGTAVGYKRIVRTLGEGIGKIRMNAGHGTAAQMTAAVCIALANLTGAPVSTTQVVTSGIAGTMVASKAGLQYRSIRNIMITWVTTLPGTMMLAFLLSLLFHLVFV